MRLPSIGHRANFETARPTPPVARGPGPVEALRPGTALLIVQRGPNTGARFLLDDAEVTSGAAPTATSSSTT